jgi:flavin reductase (DIM6/NTAB) family NADH-FMN oxidoreductase RutF
MSDDPDRAFEHLSGAIDYPMFVVTTSDGEERSGCLIGFVTQASINPPRLLVLLSKANHTFSVAQRTSVLAVHYLNADNHPLSALFGEQTGDEIDKFGRCDWTEGPYGLPILAGVNGWVIGQVLDRLDCGDHVAHLLSVEAAEVANDGPQLGFQMARDLDAGHDP